MKIYLASDHAGFGLKQFLGDHLKELGHAVEDCGALEMDPLDDYPDFIIPAAKKLQKIQITGALLWVVLDKEKQLRQIV